MPNFLAELLYMWLKLPAEHQDVRLGATRRPCLAAGMTLLFLQIFTSFYLELLFDEAFKNEVSAPPCSCLRRQGRAVRAIIPRVLPAADGRHGKTAAFSTPACPLAHTCRDTTHRCTDTYSDTLYTTRW